MRAGRVDKISHFFDKIHANGKTGIFRKKLTTIK